MKKFQSFVTVLALGSVLFLGSCSKNNDENTTPTPTQPDAALTVNENTNKTDSKTIVVPRSQSNVTLQVTSVTTTSSDQKRLYIYKTDDDASTGTYQNISGFKTETVGGQTYYYYEIPADQKNNVTYTHSFPLRTTAGADHDTYQFTITNGTISNSANILMGPVTFTVKYGKLNKTEGLRVYNVLGTHAGAFDLKTLTAKSASEGSDLKDVQDEDPTTSDFEKKWKAQNDTRFVSVGTISDADQATLSDMDLKAKYNALTAIPSATTPVLATGDFIVAKLRGQDQYALIKITNVYDDNQSGAGHNEDYIEFSVWK